MPMLSNASTPVVSSSKLLPLGIGAGGLIIGTLFVFIGWRLWNSSIELVKSGTTSHATVLKKYRKAEGATWGGLENYFVELDYSSSTGEKHRAHLRVQSKVWRQLAEGGRFGVSYLSSKPDQVVAGSVLAHKVRCGIGVVMIAVGLVAAIAFPVGALLEALRG